MSIGDRDKKILMGIVPVLLLVGFWFLLLAPKRSEAVKVDAQLAKAEKSRDAAEAKAGTVETAKADYAKDYETVVRLGKAIPSSVDMPSLIVQLSHAAKGTHIDFRKVKTGDRTASVAPSSSSTSSGSSGSSSGSSSPPPSGGASSSGSSTSSGSSSGASSGSGTPSSGGTGSSSSGASGTPAAGGAAAAGSSSSAPGLDSIPLEFGFDGSFFDLADFFHRMKRFVHMANSGLKVDGRLLTIDSFSFDTVSFPSLKGEIKATVYLAPKTEGTTAGATPGGPSATPAASTQGAAPSSTPASSPSSGTPR